MAHTLIVFDREDIKIEHQGFKGRACLKASEELFEALGTKMEFAQVEVKPEFHDQGTGQNEQQKQA